MKYKLSAVIKHRNRGKMWINPSIMWTILFLGLSLQGPHVDVYAQDPQTENSTVQPQQTSTITSVTTPDSTRLSATPNTSTVELQLSTLQTTQMQQTSESVSLNGDPVSITSQTSPTQVETTLKPTTAKYTEDTSSTIYTSALTTFESTLPTKTTESDNNILTTDTSSMKISNDPATSMQVTSQSPTLMSQTISSPTSSLAQNIIISTPNSDITTSSSKSEQISASTLRTETTTKTSTDLSHQRKDPTPQVSTHAATKEGTTIPRLTTTAFKGVPKEPLVKDEEPFEVKVQIDESKTEAIMNGSDYEKKLLVNVCKKLLMAKSVNTSCHLTGTRKNGTHIFTSASVTVIPAYINEIYNEVIKAEAHSKHSDYEVPKTMIAILASCGALVLILLAFAVYCSYHRRSYRKNQQHLTEELQTVENGYHDNPTLEVMEVQPEMQEKKLPLNGEFNDSWIVPFDTLAKDDIADEEDTHL